MNVLDFLRDIGKHFTINHMIAKDSVKGRMEDREQGISYTEFSYMLLQAYDYYYLLKKEGCTLQIGASDQWGNITAGTDLIRRKLALTGDTTVAYGLTHPLITRSDGAKFGKSESGTIWLNAKKTSPFQFYQFFISSPDDKVLEWLKLLTFVPLNEMAHIEASLKSEPEKKVAQNRLAQELTTLVHGPDATQRAITATNALFSTEIKNLDAQTLQEVFSSAPSVTKKRADLATAGAGLLDLLVEAGLFQSKGAARKEIPAGGVYLNNERTTDTTLILNESHLIAGDMAVLRKGKKHYALVRFST
jgi:tyrosyl-tRNA synthetase